MLNVRTDPAPVLEANPDYWFWALQNIVGDGPVIEENSIGFKELRNLWLHWGRERNLV